jgi:hypothetical protein
MEDDELLPPVEIRDNVRLERINVNYTDDLQGRWLSRAHTIRADNGRFYTRDEMTHFRDRSRKSAPTYGNCAECFASGPIGKRCAVCFEQRNMVHPYEMMMCHPNKILDAEFLSRFAGQPHKKAKADREVRWLNIPQSDIRGEGLMLMLMSKIHQDVPRGELRQALIERDRELWNRLILWPDT